MSNYLADEELPPLPEPEGVIVVHTQALRAFTADQMRDFARVAIAAYLEKHGEVVAWYHDEYGTVELSRIRRVGWKPLFAAPKPTPQERQDAARYRKIRWYAVARGYMPKDWDRVLRDTRATDAEFDSVIDAAMSKEPQR